MKLSNKFAIAFIVALVAASGCISQAAPTPTPTPVPTLLPTASPTATPTDSGHHYPSTIGVIQSGQLTIENVKISYARGAEKQAEVFSVHIKNNGFEWANNTFISLRVTDSQTDQYYYADQFFVGNISPNEIRWFNMTTTSHDYASSELIKMDWFWGDNLEFRNGMEKSYSLAFLPYAS